MKTWRVILKTERGPIWPYCIASLSMSAVPIPLPALHNVASPNITSARRADSFLKNKRIKHILSGLLVRGALAYRQ
jgi:hypothetical protein